MIYQIWNSASGNLVADFDGEAAALAFLERSLHEHGAAYVERLGLLVEDQDGQTGLVADGVDLVSLVRDRVAPVASAVGMLTRPA